MSLLCSLAFIAWLFPSCIANTQEAFPGYVEGEYAALAPTATARIKDVRVRRGDVIVPGTIVATLENEDTELGIVEAEAAAAEAAAQLENLRKGRRTVEIEAIEATLAAAEAQARAAQTTLNHQQTLIRRGVASRASADEAQAAVDAAESKVREIEANLAAAQMPAREDEIRAAEQRYERAKSALAQARWKHEERYLVAEVRGQVFDIIRRPGEIASPSQPVISVLPTGATLVRFYAPEPVLSQMPVGAKVAVACDGCPPDLQATISYRASEPEFTPPVIYSVERRQKLVFLIEARPVNGNTYLQPGQIVTVTLPKAQHHADD